MIRVTVVAEKNLKNAVNNMTDYKKTESPFDFGSSFSGFKISIIQSPMAKDGHGTLVLSPNDYKAYTEKMKAKFCSNEGCGHEVYSNGLCQQHYADVRYPLTDEEIENGGPIPYKKPEYKHDFGVLCNTPKCTRPKHPGHDYCLECLPF